MLQRLASIHRRRAQDRQAYPKADWEYLQEEFGRGESALRKVCKGKFVTAEARARKKERARAYG